MLMQLLNQVAIYVLILVSLSPIFYTNYSCYSLQSAIFLLISSRFLSRIIIIFLS